jgi:hypothetical protein
MRTQEQINNIRNVLQHVFSPWYIKLLTDQDIDDFADILQKQVSAERYHWVVRVQMSNEKRKELIWNKIEPEPTRPYCSIGLIRDKCNDLFKKYIRLSVIYVQAVEDPNLKYFFLRSKLLP